MNFDWKTILFDVAAFGALDYGLHYLKLVAADDFKNEVINFAVADAAYVAILNNYVLAYAPSSLGATTVKAIAVAALNLGVEYARGKRDLNMKHILMLAGKAAAAVYVSAPLEGLVMPK